MTYWRVYFMCFKRPVNEWLQVLVKCSSGEAALMFSSQNFPLNKFNFVQNMMQKSVLR